MMPATVPALLPGVVAVSDPVLFPFIDSAMQIVAACAVVGIFLFFLSSLSDAWRSRGAVRVADYDDDRATVGRTL